MSGRPRQRLAAGSGRVVRPTPERIRHGAAYGGIASLAADTETGADVGCVAVRYPLLVDYLRDAGRLAPADHEIALRVRELYEHTDFRAHLTGAYAERTSRTSGESEREWANDRYRRLEARVLRRAGRGAWTALRAIVIEDRMTASARFLQAALREAARWL